MNNECLWIIITFTAERYSIKQFPARISSGMLNYNWFNILPLKKAKFTGMPLKIAGNIGLPEKYYTGYTGITEIKYL